MKSSIAKYAMWFIVPSVVRNGNGISHIPTLGRTFGLGRLAGFSTLTLILAAGTVLPRTVGQSKPLPPPPFPDAPGVWSKRFSACGFPPFTRVNASGEGSVHSRGQETEPASAPCESGGVL